MAGNKGQIPVFFFIVPPTLYVEMPKSCFPKHPDSEWLDAQETVLTNKTQVELFWAFLRKPLCSCFRDCLTLLHPFLLPVTWRWLWGLELQQPSRKDEENVIDAGIDSLELLNQHLDLGISCCTSHTFLLLNIIPQRCISKSTEY